MQELKRKKGETFESFLRRFNKRILYSGVILEFKSKRYHQKEKSDNLRRKSALIRKKRREQFDYLKKIGKLPEETFGKKRY